MAEFTLTSDAFGDGEEIPKKFTCEGGNTSPALSWSDPPEGARSLALIMDDPDAPSGTFVHWVAWGLDPSAGGLVEAEPAPSEGTNSSGNTGYGGPCPPPGHGRHRYYFHLHALDADPDVQPDAGREELEAAIEGHVLATAELMGGYERSG
jgi:Raf kinase inhibitor-like YbhB/YbcL family protein